MPRTKSDKIITHRIEFSPKERELIDTVIKTQKENQRLDAVTNTFQAAGVAISGSGLLIAGLAVAGWFGYNAKDKIKEAIQGFSSTTADAMGVLITGKSVDTLSQEIFDDMGIDLKRLKEQAQDLRDRKNRFCDTSSQYYDAQLCAQTDVQLENHKRLIKRENERLIQEVRSFDGSTARNEILDRQRKGTLLWGISNINGIGQLMRL